MILLALILSTLLNVTLLVSLRNARKVDRERYEGALADRDFWRNIATVWEHAASSWQRTAEESMEVNREYADLMRMQRVITKTITVDHEELN